MLTAGIKCGSEHKPTLKEIQRPCNWYYWDSFVRVNESVWELANYMVDFNISVGCVTFHSWMSLTESPTPPWIWFLPADSGNYYSGNFAFFIQ